MPDALRSVSKADSVIARVFLGPGASGSSPNQCDMNADIPRRRAPLFDYSTTVDPTMHSLGWRYILVSYAAAVIPLLGIVLPRDGRTDWPVGAVVLAVAASTMVLNAFYFRRMYVAGGWNPPPALVVLVQAVVMTAAVGWLNVALSDTAGFYRPIILVPTLLVAIIGNRKMLIVTAGTAAITLAWSTAAQGVDPAHLPAFLLSYGATWGLVIVLVRFLAARAIRATAISQGFIDAATISAQSESIEVGVERLVPVIGQWAEAEQVCAFEAPQSAPSALASWPPGTSHCAAPDPGLIRRAWASDGAAVDGRCGVIVAGTTGESEPTLAITIVNAERAHLDDITYRFQLSRMADQLSTLVDRTRQIAHLESLGNTDSLTGLPNRRALEQRLDDVAETHGSKGELALAIIDLDDFKAYNDTYGHPAGDVLLREFALSLRSCVRASDFVARYGGEEFCLVLPDSSADGAVALIEQLRSRLSSPDNKVAFSAGVATREAGESAESLIERADNALYRAKGTGKDRTVVD